MLPNCEKIVVDTAAKWRGSSHENWCCLFANGVWKRSTGHADAVLRRTAKTGDGWLTNYRTASEAKPHLDRLRALIEEAGRSPEQVGIEPRVSCGNGAPYVWRRKLTSWQAAGATHLSLNTMYCGFETPPGRIEALREYAGEILE